MAATLTSHREEVAELRAAAEIIQERLATLPTAPPLYGPIHGDTDASNVFVDRQQAITLIDFDYFGVGWRAYDLAAFLDEVRVYWKQSEDYEAAFLAGYASQRTLAPDEWAALPFFLAARKLFVLSLYTRHIDTWGRFRLTNRYISGIVSRVRAYLADGR